MLKRKLARHRGQSAEMSSDGGAAVDTSEHFSIPIWKKFYDLEVKLNAEIRLLRLPSSITHTYNPVEYAAGLHCAYLRRFLEGPKRLVFVGMNPGPYGMAQTGIPFGNIHTVRCLMGISGEVPQPDTPHPKRPVNGMECTREEESGKRIWSVFLEAARGSLDNFKRQSFVHNFCPLAFFDEDGKNITPSEIKGDAKIQIRDVCLRYLDEQLTLLQPEIVVAVGDYVFNCLKKSAYMATGKLLKLPHPSPRSLNNQNWEENAQTFLIENDLKKYMYEA